MQSAGRPAVSSPAAPAAPIPPSSSFLFFCAVLCLQQKERSNTTRETRHRHTAVRCANLGRQPSTCDSMKHSTSKRARSLVNASCTCHVEEVLQGALFPLAAVVGDVHHHAASRERGSAGLSGGAAISTAFTCSTSLHISTTHITAQRHHNAGATQHTASLRVERRNRWIGSRVDVFGRSMPKVWRRSLSVADSQV